MAGHIADSLSVHWCTEDRIVGFVREFFGGPPDLDPCSNPNSRVGAAAEWTLENGHDGLQEPWLPHKNVYVNPPFGKGWWRPAAHTKIACLGWAGKGVCSCGASERREYMWPAERAALVKAIETGRPVNANSGLQSRAELKKYLATFKPVSIADWIEKCANYGDLGAGVVGLIPAYPGTRAWQRHVWKRARAVFFPSGRLHFRLVSHYVDSSGQSITVEKTGPAPMDCAMPYWGPLGAGDFKRVFEPHGHVVGLR